MEILYLGIVFAVIVGLLALHRPLYQSILGGLLATVLLFRIPISEVPVPVIRVFAEGSSLSALVSLYLITYLQRMLDARGLIRKAQQNLDALFHNRRVNATVAPLFIGTLPSAAAMILCGDIVRDSTEGYLRPWEQAFVTSWVRHVPESILPTYASVLLMITLSGQSLPSYILAMIPPAIILTLLGYFPYIHRLPKDPGTARKEGGSRKQEMVGLLQNLWPLLLILLLILAGKVSVVLAVLLSVAAMAVVYRFSVKELAHISVSAFDVNLLQNTFLVLVLKEFFVLTGVLQTLPEVLSVLPIPTYLIFAVMCFLGGIISGTQGTIALSVPLAFAAIPNGGTPLVVLLMCMAHAASQVSPTHVCLVVAAEYYHVGMGELIRKSMPRALLFCVLMVGYYHLLQLIF